MESTESLDLLIRDNITKWLKKEAANRSVDFSIACSKLFNVKLSRKVASQFECFILEAQNLNSSGGFCHQLKTSKVSFSDFKNEFEGGYSKSEFDLNREANKQVSDLTLGLVRKLLDGDAAIESFSTELPEKDPFEPIVMAGVPLVKRVMNIKVNIYE